LNKIVATAAILIVTAVILVVPTLVEAQSYEQIKTITGSGNQTTDYFNVPTNEWRIDWSYVPDPSFPVMAGFAVFAYPKGESTIYTTNIVKFGDSNTSGVTYVHQGQNDYYLNITVTSVKSYTITVEAQQGASASPSVPEYPITAILIGCILVASVFIVLTKKRLTPRA